MSYITYGELKKAVQRELDIEDELFVTKKELVSYCNQAINEAESLIYTINEDYFLDSSSIYLIQGVSVYNLPKNIYAFKIRRLIYNNGGVCYTIKRIRNLNKFELVEDIKTFGKGDFYSYIIQNSPVKDLVINTLNGVDTFTYANHGLIENERVIVKENFGISIPAPFEEKKDYYVVSATTNTFKLSASPQGTPIVPTQTSSMRVINESPKIVLLPEARETGDNFVKIWYIRNCNKLNPNDTEEILDETIIDIPEFSPFLISYMKYMVLKKEGNPMLEEAKIELERNKELMVSTLTEQVPDNDDKIQMDLSFYKESV